MLLVQLEDLAQVLRRERELVHELVRAHPEVRQALLVDELERLFQVLAGVNCADEIARKRRRERLELIEAEETLEDAREGLGLPELVGERDFGESGLESALHLQVLVIALRRLDFAEVLGDTVEIRLVQLQQIVGDEERTAPCFQRSRRFYVLL